jgi:aldehyde:ferredoxin oxidoreductase
MGLSYATSDRGACHLRATFYKPEISGMIPPEQIEGKAELFLDFEDRLTLFDTLILCRFYRDFYDWDQLAKMIYAVTGIDEGKEGLRQKARQIADLIRRFNLREGLKPEDDHLPKIFHQKLEDSGQVITEEELETMLQDYYRLHGWDKNGIPLT